MKVSSSSTASTATKELDNLMASLSGFNPQSSNLNSSTSLTNQTNRKGEGGSEGGGGGGGMEGGGGGKGDGEGGADGESGDSKLGQVEEGPMECSGARSVEGAEGGDGGGENEEDQLDVSALELTSTNQNNASKVCPKLPQIGPNSSIYQAIRA